MAKKKKTTKKLEANIPPVSKQTAGGITGAVIGGLVGGPVVAAVAGLAGAMVGDSSAKGNKPIGTTVKTIQSKLTGDTSQKLLASSKEWLGKSSKSKPAAKTKEKKTSGKETNPKVATKKAKGAKTTKSATKKKAKRPKKRATKRS